MKKVFRNKLIGTICFVIIIGGLVLTTFIVGADARFITSRAGINVDGTVLGITSSTLTVDTYGSQPIVFNLGLKTMFADGWPAPGDMVRVRGRLVGNEATAIMISKQDMGTGYGTQGDRVIVSWGEVVGKTSQTFTVDNDSTLVTFRVLTSTNFMGKLDGLRNFATMAPGDRVSVIGEDAGYEFVARNVLFK